MTFIIILILTTTVEQNEGDVLCTRDAEMCLKVVHS